jgi:hypothetical protein
VVRGARADVEEVDQPTKLGVTRIQAVSPRVASFSGAEGSVSRRHCVCVGT